jgi:cystathionine beta-lyase
MMDFPMDFATPIDRTATDSLKWDKYAGRDILPLWVADMDFAAPPAVLEALQQRISHGIFGYTRPGQQLNATTVDYLKHNYGWAVQSEDLIWLPGLVPAINLACRAFARAGDALITATPVYPPFLSASGLNGMELIRTALVETAPGQWDWDFAALEAAITPATRILLLCHPQNPVGRIWTRSELDRLAAIALRHDLIVVSDEIHCDLILEEGTQHIPFASISADAAARTVTLMAPSKTYNIPGLTCAFAVIGNPALRVKFQRAMRGIMPEINVLGMTATEAAFRAGADWHQALISHLRDNAAQVVRRLDGFAGLHVRMPQATYLAWIDCRDCGLEDPARFFEAAGVGLSDGSDFGCPGFVRLNFGCTRATLDTALERMRAALQKRI